MPGDATIDPSTADEPTLAGVSAGKLGMWFYIASEVMLFAGMIGSYIVLRSGDPEVFSHEQTHVEQLLAVLAAITLLGTIAMLTWSARAARANRSPRAGLFATLACGIAFCGIAAVRPIADSRHQTILTADLAANRVDVYDGTRVATTDTTITLVGYHAVADDTLELHRVTGQSLQVMATQQGLSPAEQRFELPRSAITETISYGPWKNNYFACFDLILGVVVFHIVGGIVITVILLLQSKVTVIAIECARLYWSFFAIVWVLMLPLLYWS